MINGLNAIELARLRQGMYRFFASALLPPDEERMAQLNGAAVLLEEWGIEAFAFAPAWRSMREALDEAPPALELEGEFIRLFESGVDGALCPPNESFYLTSVRGGGAATTMATLEREYGRLGVELAEQGSHSADEASPQLELMAYLCGAEASAQEAGAADEVDRLVGEEAGFLAGHLSRWFGDFADRVASSAPQSFYAALTASAAVFVAHDREMTALLGADEGEVRP